MRSFSHAPPFADDTFFASRPTRPPSRPVSTSITAPEPVRSPGGSAPFHRYPIVAAVLGACLMHVVSTLLILLATHLQPERLPLSVSEPHPSFLATSSEWDGLWFRQATEHGYPTTLPTRPNGAIGESTWAFLPVYPWLVRAAMAITGGSFAMSGVLVSLVCSIAAMVLITVLLTPRIGPRGAIATVMLLGAWPAAPVLQMTYSESVGLLATAAALLALDRRRWPWAMALAPVCGLARPVTAPLALVVLVLVVAGWRRWDVRERILGCATGLALAAATLLWPLLAWWRTGLRDAYPRTEAAWHVHGELQPFHGWVSGFEGRFGTTWGGPVLVTVVGGLLALIVLGGRRLGLTLQAWSAGYLLYVVAAGGGMFSSATRIIMLAWPILPMLIGLGRRRSGWTRHTTAAWMVSMGVLLTLEVAWTLEVLVLRPPYQPV